MPQVHLVADKDIAFSTIGSRMRQATDDSAAVLVAHLLIEALLFRFVQTRVDDPEPLDIVQWTFREIATMAQALRRRRRDEQWLWNTISELNHIRNRLSHDIEVSDLPGMLERLYEAAGPRIDIHAPDADPAKREANKLKTFLIILCAVVQKLQKKKARS